MKLGNLKEAMTSLEKAPNPQGFLSYNHSLGMSPLAFSIVSIERHSNNVEMQQSFSEIANLTFQDCLDSRDSTLA